MCRSDPQTFESVRRTSAAPGSGSGTGYSRISNGAPAFARTTARPYDGIVILPRNAGQPAPLARKTTTGSPPWPALSTSSQWPLTRPTAEVTHSFGRGRHATTSAPAWSVDVDARRFSLEHLQQLQAQQPGEAMT